MTPEQKKAEELVEKIENSLDENVWAFCSAGDSHVENIQEASIHLAILYCKGVIEELESTVSIQRENHYITPALTHNISRLRLYEDLKSILEKKLCMLA